MLADRLRAILSFLRQAVDGEIAPVFYGDDQVPFGLHFARG